MKAIILAGGKGTRLWPASTDETPKQFQALISGKTLLKETFDRLDFLKKEDIFVSTNEKYLPYVKKILPSLKEDHIISEPEMRDTAPSIGLAAALIEKKYGPNEVLAIIYADHYIRNKKEFQKKLFIAEKVAKEDKSINIIEVKARYANTNLGYVKIGNLLKTIDSTEIYGFEGFKEKPDLKTAKKMINSFSYLWNTGHYVSMAGTLLNEYKKHAPEIYQYLEKIKKAQNEKEEIAKIYGKMKKISIDYAVMEKINKEKVRIIPADLGWNDIGTWKALYDELAPYNGENILKGKIALGNSKENLIYNYHPEIKIATIGLQNFVVVLTKDNLLICPLQESHKIKELLNNQNLID